MFHGVNNKHGWENFFLSEGNFRDLTPCNPVDVQGHFGGTYCLDLWAIFLCCSPCPSLGSFTWAFHPRLALRPTCLAHLPSTLKIEAVSSSKMSV